MDLYRQDTTKFSALGNEPAVTIGVAATLLLQAIFALLRASNVAATAEMEQSTTLLVMALLNFPLITSIATRFFAFSQNSAAQIAQGTYDGGK